MTPDGSESASGDDYDDDVDEESQATDRPTARQPDKEGGQSIQVLANEANFDELS